jgi:hypothetical protein
MATLHFRPGFTGFPTIPKRWKWQENAANWSRNCNFQEEKTCLALPVENLRPVRGWIPAKICWLLKYILYIILYIYLIISYIYILLCVPKKIKNPANLMHITDARSYIFPRWNCISHPASSDLADGLGGIVCGKKCLERRLFTEHHFIVY